MAGGELFVPCPHCRSVLRYKVGSTGELLSGDCLLCGHPFPGTLLEAIGHLVAERVGAEVLDSDGSSPLSLSELAAGQLVG
jgi:hypothetical protein